MSRARWADTWSELAAARFVLASIVAIAHMHGMLGSPRALGVLQPVPWFGAFEAILGFLAISGYSIGRSYAGSPDGFFWRRAQRIYPVYLASIVITLAVHPSSPSLGLLAILAANVLFLNQLVTATSFVGPAWSLSLEVWLYASTPALERLRPRTVVTLVCASFVAYCAYTCGRTLFHWPYYAGLAFGLNLPLLAFAWLGGYLVARREADGGRALLLLGATYAVHMAMTAGIDFMSHWRRGTLDAYVSSDLPELACRSLTLAGIWWLLSRSRRADAFAAPPSVGLRFLGDISYPLYLVHYQLIELVRRLDWTSNPVLLYVVVIVVSAALYLALDAYSRRRHLGARGTPPATSAAPAPARSE